ncbi:MAG: DEAD/DEAH box helicase, partial [Solirubrobacteraceae bacterium]
MALRTLLQPALDDPAAATLARDGGRAFVASALRPYLIAALAEADATVSVLVVAADDRAARDLAVDLRAWLRPRAVRFYPSRGVSYESHLVPPPHLVGLRIAALDALREAEAPVVVVSAVALSEKVPDPELRPHGFVIEKGELLDLEETAQDLVAAGYERVDQVEDRGQFAIRGGILDLYPATEERAVRIDLFDDEVESLRLFSTFTQRSLGDAERVEIAPAAELAPQHRELAEIAALEEERPDIAELLPVDRFHAFFDLVPERAHAILAAEEEVGPALADHWQDVCAAFHDADAHHLYVRPDEVERALAARARVRLSATSSDQPVRFHAQAADTAARSLREAEAELEKLVRSGYRTVVAWPRRGEGERAAYNLARSTPGWLDGGPVHPGELKFATAALREGFVAPGFKVAVLPEHRLLRRRRAEDAPRPRAGRLRSFADLRTGDIVVHEDHGIARFLGFETKTVGGVTRDYLELEYRDGDRVFVPSDQLHKISRYVGADARDPQLSALGGKQWEKQKLRARRAAQALAGELINLYAERKRRAGYAFPSNTEWERDFEAAFPYQETPDQLDAIEQVKADMEEARPMDRLICGDVGYGKTEVAMRAAFKAAEAGKQVMFLVPTTVLAAQHYGTFAERMRDYPFTMAVASRFQKPAAVKQSLAEFSEGKLDILIGTHRLLSRDVRPKDLGLLIVDEEQRFGVKQKELLRQLRLKVDVLSLSATPIPRTLQMSLAGLRDISVIETPPEGRRPVNTYVGEYDEDLVKQAIERELERKGQVFFLHNRVETIDETAVRIQALVPKARVRVAHGQMDEKQLEDRMLHFLRGDADVLVSTSIIESG